MALVCAAAGTSVTSARADYFGAIAISKSTLRYGWSYDFGSQADAEAEAKKRCAESDCEIAIWYSNACGALAFGDGNSWGADWGADQDIATQKAIQACSGYGKNCHLEHWTCTSR